jgi:hypothetical protein
MRRQSLEALGAALLQYAHAHDGRFPPHDFVNEIPAKIWEAPDSSGTRYLYVGGLMLTQSNSMLACEPQNFGNERLILLGDGRIEAAKTEDIHKLMAARDQK